MNEYIYGSVECECIPEFKLERREEIVRCRDCKHYREHEFVLITDVSDVCLFWAEGVKVAPDGFCAWGERREGAES